MKKKYKIFLDGFRDPENIYSKQKSKDWVEIVDIETLQAVVQTNYSQSRALPSLISIGHDLKDGVSLIAIKWLLGFFLNHEEEFPKIEIHEDEPVRKSNLNTIIGKYLDNPSNLL